jgi:predicted nucleotidyltransferase/tetratricopeptide (TPR) repeat protein
LNRHADAWAAAEKVRDYCMKLKDWYGLFMALGRLESFYLNDGDLRQADNIRKQRIKILTSLQYKSSYMEMGILGGMGFYRALLSGRYHEAEQELGTALSIARELNATDLAYILRDWGFVLGMEGKYVDAESAFVESLSVFKFDAALQNVEDPIANGFWGFILQKQRRFTEAEQKLLHSLGIEQRVGDWFEIPKLHVWLGELYETRFLLESSDDQLELAGSHYNEAISLTRSLQSRHNFRVWALTGLTRVKHAQGDYPAIPPLLAEAEGLAQQYEYNDHLASLRLTQGHIAWEGNAPTWENGFDAALRYYQHALIYALRYNRFLLDEVLSGRPQGTPLRPIIPECLKRGEEGRRMLIALRDWWQTGVNDIGTPRPGTGVSSNAPTISPIPEGIPLLEAERIAREREPGDGTPQKSVVEQIESGTGIWRQAMNSALMIAIQRFRAELEKMGIRCDRILLFGSQANGTAQEGSDIDLIVVSPDWARYNDRERFEILGIAAARILEPIQARGITPEEIATHRLSPFWEQILQEQAIAIA